MRVKCNKCGKLSFPSEANARENLKQTDCVEVYQCNYNGTWHMTTHPRGRVIIRRKRDGWRVYSDTGKISSFKNFEDAINRANKLSKSKLNEPKRKLAALKSLAERGEIDLILKYI